MKFVFKHSQKPTFSQKGLKGYQFKPHNIFFVDVKQGHDTYIISKKIIHTYYILEGCGTFDIKGKRYPARKGMLIEVPKGVEYTYSGKMKILLMLDCPWFKGNEKITKKNPRVKS